MEKSSPKIIVIGSGVAGMAAALSAAERGAFVTMISRAEPFRSSSSRLRDGIAAALDMAGECDSAALHAADTIKCGDFLAHEKRVKAMCEAAPGIVELLARMGVAFERTPEGMVRLTRPGGASRRRVASAGRGSGVHVLSALSSQVLRAQSMERAFLMPGWEFLSLVQGEGGACCGVVAQNLRNMEIKAIAADAVIICTGGYPAIFARHAAAAESDGAAAAACYAQGALFANPEFVQLTPFAIGAAGKWRALPDAVLAEGGRAFVDKDGRPWHVLEELFPQSQGLVPRDVAVRAIWRSMKEAAMAEGSPAKAFIDVTHLDPDFAEDQLPSFFDACEGLPGLDPLHAPVEVGPAVFATMGGLWTDEDHSTNIPGLFAAGSAACQYHGAGIQAGNELLSSIYGGMKAGSAATAFSRGTGAAGAAPSAMLNAAKSREEDVVAHIAAQEGRENAHAVARELGELLFATAGIEKDNAELKKSLAKIGELADRFSKAPLLDRSEWANAELSFMRRMRQRLSLAKLVVAASIARDESRGSHFKPAFQNRDDAKWLVITKATWAEDSPTLDHSERIELATKPDERAY
ncbi:MAG: FAD-dependent oxidoreductase [bacterium]